jgi:hypothetical protein
MSINFNLSALNVDITMSASGELLKVPLETITADATGEFYVKTSDIRGVFMYQTDSDDINTITNTTDIKYFIRQKQWPHGLILNPCNAYVSNGQIATTDRLGKILDFKELVKHDFIRYIAMSLFGTHLAVDLFSNEDQLKYDLTYKGYYTAWNNIWNSMVSISDISLNTTTYSGLYGEDPSYGYYLTNDCSNNLNITRQLLNQIIRDKPERLQNIQTYTIDASKGFYLIPLIDGDSILFKLTLNAAPNQHKLLNGITEIPPRSYKIRINLVSSVNNDYVQGSNINIIPNDLKPTIYNGSLTTQDLNNTFPSNYNRNFPYMLASTGRGIWFNYISKINLYLFSVADGTGTIVYTPNINEITRLVKNVKMSSELTSYMNKGLLVSIANNPASDNNLHVNPGRLFNNTLNPHRIAIANRFPIFSSNFGASNDGPNWIYNFSFIFKPISTSTNTFSIDMGSRTGVYGIYIINVEDMTTIQFSLSGGASWSTTLGMGGRDRTLTFSYIPNNKYLVFMFMGTSNHGAAINGISKMRFAWRYPSLSSTWNQDFSSFDYPIFNYNNF